MLLVYIRIREYCETVPMSQLFLKGVLQLFFLQLIIARVYYQEYATATGDGHLLRHSNVYLCKL